MLAQLNEKFAEWEGFDRWQKTAYATAVGLFCLLVVYASVQYWAFNADLINGSVAMLGFFLLIYLLLLTLFGSMSVWLCGFIGTAVATLFGGIAWLYRKICP